MRQKKRIIGLLSICLLTVGIVSVYAQAKGGNPLDEVWSTITTIINRIDALESRVDVLESIGPTYTIRLSTLTMDPYGSFDVWSYVTNPSLTIERIIGDDPQDDEGPLHNVEVQYLAMTSIDPDGETSWCTFYPNGWVEDSSGGEHIEWIELRWDSTVHPGETSLVYYGGWGWETSEEGALPGIWQWTYELCVEYEDTTYILANTFEINVVEP